MNFMSSTFFFSEEYSISRSEGCRTRFHCESTMKNLFKYALSDTEHHWITLELSLDLLFQMIIWQKILNVNVYQGLTSFQASYSVFYIVGFL